MKRHVLPTVVCASVLAMLTPARANEPAPLPGWLGKVQLWNCGGVEPTEDGQGVLLYRVPKKVRDQLDTVTPDGKEKDGAKQMRVAAHSEIRFVLNEGAKLENVKLHLRSKTGPSVFWFWGDVLAGDAKVSAGERATPITPYGHGLLFSLMDQYPKGRFANRVCRVVVQGLEVEFRGIEGDVRPPKPDELAPVMLSYGTSISQGAYASRADLAWNALTARALGYDFINLGSSGTAYCEPAIADYLAGLTWDLCVLEISVNMGDFTTEQFKERAGGMIDKLAKTHPKAQIVCISLFPFGTGDLWAANKPKTQERRDALAEIVKASGHRNVHFVSGPELLSFTGLSPDMLHPSDHGMIEISTKLALRIREISARGKAQP
jgi:lysophospholipase L1-like esterase